MDFWKKTILQVFRRVNVQEKFFELRKSLLVECLI